MFIFHLVKHVQITILTNVVLKEKLKVYVKILELIVLIF